MAGARLKEVVDSSLVRMISSLARLSVADVAAPALAGHLGSRAGGRRRSSRWSEGRRPRCRLAVARGGDQFLPGRESVAPAQRRAGARSRLGRRPAAAGRKRPVRVSASPAVRRCPRWWRRCPRWAQIGAGWRIGGEGVVGGALRRVGAAGRGRVGAGRGFLGALRRRRRDRRARADARQRGLVDDAAADSSRPLLWSGCRCCRRRRCA